MSPGHPLWFVAFRPLHSTPLHSTPCSSDMVRDCIPGILVRRHPTGGSQQPLMYRMPNGNPSTPGLSDDARRLLARVAPHPPPRPPPTRRHTSPPTPPGRLAVPFP